MPVRILANAMILLALSVPAAAGPQLSVDRLGGYADVADLALASPLIVRATITRARPAPARTAGTAPAGRTRMQIMATVSNPLVAPASIGQSLQFLWDVPIGKDGRPQDVRDFEILGFFSPPAADGATRLVSRRGVQPWDPALADQVRAIVAENRSGAVPVITGVSNGFRADGTVPGESESQFFLTSADGRPATLVVQNRPGEVRRILLARGDVIDESAERIRPATLIWYRLACFLPTRLPNAAGGTDPALARDWQDALASLGPCGRTGQNEANSTPTARQSG